MKHSNIIIINLGVVHYNENKLVSAVDKYELVLSLTAAIQLCSDDAGGEEGRQTSNF